MRVFLGLKTFSFVIFQVIFDIQLSLTPQKQKNPRQREKKKIKKYIIARWYVNQDVCY